MTPLTMLARPEEETPAFKIRFSATATHELGHHWFGDLVTTAWWDDIWLNEAFATWVEAKILVPWKPAFHYDLVDARSTQRAMLGDSLVSARRIRQGSGRYAPAARAAWDAHCRGQALRRRG